MLQQRIFNREKDGDEKDDRLSFTMASGLAQIDYYGFAFGESFENLIDLLCHPIVAANTQSLTLRSPDAGANGTFYWGFTALNQSHVVFPNLTSFFVEPGHRSWHNSYKSSSCVIPS
jgi:hypothetical protein